MPPQRVVSLCPSITETLVSIGALPRLVGATRFCTRPRGVLRGLARVGGTKDPSVAAVAALRPDLVFANREENRREDVEAIRAKGIEVDLTLPKRVADVPRDVLQWGRRLGGACQAEAEALASRIEEELAGLESEPPARPFRYAYWIWMDPWMSVSDDTYVADLLRLAGGVNVFGGDAERYPTTTPGESVARGAQVQFFPDEPYPFRARRHEELGARLFGREARLLFVSGDDYCWHGVRTLSGLGAMRELRARLAAGR